MKLTILEFNKTTTSSIDEFSDSVQKIINENNDLVTFKPYESPYNGVMKLELVFGDSKSSTAEIMAFGPAHPDNVLEQINGTLSVVAHQNKAVKFAGLVPMSKSIRAIGFIVLEKGTEHKGTNSSVESKEPTEERTEDSTSNARTARRRKSAK